MSEDLIRYLETQDEAVTAMFVQNMGDELTNILVAALEEAFEILVVEDPSATLHQATPHFSASFPCAAIIESIQAAAALSEAVCRRGAARAACSPFGGGL